MSFFDEVETTVANTRFLQAQEDHGPIVLPLKHAQQLRHMDESLRPTVTIDLLLRPNTTAQYLFKQFLCTQGQQDAVHLLTEIEQYRKVGGSQRSILARRIMKEHELLAQPPPASASIPQGGLAYIMPAAAASSSSSSSSSAAVAPAAMPASNGVDGEAPAAQHADGSSSSPPHPLAPASPSKAAGAAASSSSSAAIPPPPCLDLVLAAPLSSHPLCSHLAQTAAVELIELQREIASHPPGAPPPTLFDNLSLRISQRLRDQVGPFLASPFYEKFLQLEDYSAHEVKLSEFRIFRVLGRGAFGAVSAVQKIDTHAIFAMKEMGKKQVKADQSEWMVINECKVLSKMSSPFVLNLKYSFHEEDTLYLIFDMCAGGDLKFHLRAAKEKCFELPRARFYAAEILLGLEAMHSIDIVYRDLKPNNILLNQDGHVVISDLGLTIKLRKNKVLKHLAGTAGYWSPEVVSKSGTYKTSDWWSYGVMLYEMLVGSRPACVCDKKTKQWCPFGQKRSMEENALDPEGTLKLDIQYPPDKIPSAARELLEALFNPDPLKRLGANGVEEIKSARFFSEIDWEAMALCEVTPPYIPDSRTVNANSIGEVGEFSKAAFKHVTLTAEDDKIYEGFRYTSSEGLQKELIEAMRKMDNPNGPNNPEKHGEGGTKTESTGGCCIIL